MVELLIVVAIIGILAGIAIPNFMGARTKAQVARAFADMDAIGKAEEMYYMDHPDDGYTDTSSDLVPVYIRTWPSEPWGNDYRIGVTSDTVGVNVAYAIVDNGPDAASNVTIGSGSWNWNAAVNGAQDLTLNANNGTVYTAGIGVGALVISANAAELGGNISATSVNTTGVGLTTLTTDITITASGTGDAINLGDMNGAHSLTLVASNGDVILRDANIAALTVTDAGAVYFNGNFVTSGAVSVAGSVSAAIGSIAIASGASIQAGGDIDLDTKTNSGGGSITINGNVSTTGDSTITITSDDDVNIAQTADAAITAENGIKILLSWSFSSSNFSV